MVLGKPVSITLYDPETNEEKSTFHQAFIPWKMLKRAIKINREIVPNLKTREPEINEAMIDDLTDLVVDTFGGRFTREELENGADAQQMITVVNEIVAKAQNINPNPPPAG